VDGHTGLLVADSVASFAHAMTTISLLSERELDVMAEHARARAGQFPWSRFVDRIDAHVEEVAGRTRVPA
jgi:hypothetical protein